MKRTKNARAFAQTCLWDSQYGPSNAVFNTYREFMCRTFLPWSIEWKFADVFHGRAEGMLFPTRALAKIQSTPIGRMRGAAELEDSPAECIYANYVLRGELQVQQGERNFIARPGDLVVYESRHPVIIKERSADLFENLFFRLDSEDFSLLGNDSAISSCALISVETMIAPLAACLDCLSKNFSAISASEAATLIDAIGSLLPVTTLDVTLPCKAQIAQKAAMSQLLDYIDTHLGAAELSPRSAAIELGISVRYVHKLFGLRGKTFCRYVTEKRLDHARRDLASHACRHEPIYAIAARWGFRDPSTFAFLFREKFGVTPGHARA